MKAKQKIGIQIMCWLILYIFWIMVFQKREFAFTKTVTIEFCYLVFIAANFYFNIYFTVPKFLYEKKYLTFVICFLTGLIVTVLLRVPLAAFLNRNYFLVGKIQPSLLELFLNSFLNIFIWTVCILAGKLIIDRFRFQQYVDELAKQKETAELNLLNAQFNPHFLFNSINSIYGHIDRQNTVARNMLLTFSDMLRYQLYECNNQFIAIEKELNYIKSYITLQKTRKEENLAIRFSVCEDVKGFQISPLLFIAFVENAFKHVSNHEEKENKIDISFQRTNGALIFRSFNTKEVNAINTGECKGIGVANARQRLALLYPEKHNLTIAHDDHSYDVTLKLQLT
jgi:two-component system LytT family sensor kinase